MISLLSRSDESRICYNICCDLRSIRKRCMDLFCPATIMATVMAMREYNVKQ